MRIIVIAITLITLITLVLVGVSCVKCDTSELSIANVSVSNINDTGATISWTTSAPSDSRVALNESFGTSVGSLMTWDSELVTDHSLDVSRLRPDTTYPFMVKSKDESCHEAISDYYSFTTTACTSGPLTVHFIDVGQGDAILVDLD